MTKIKVLGWFFLGVFFTSMIMSFIKPSCVLCDIERYIVLVISIVCLFDKILWARAGLGLLLLVGSYHLLLQYRVFAAPSICAVGQPGAVRISCDDKGAKMFSVPMPFYVVLLSVFGLGAVWQRK